MVKQVILRCVLVKCLSAGCTEQRWVKELFVLQILGVAVTFLPPQNKLSCRSLSLWQIVHYMLYRLC